jgi:hypothetical protein
MSNSWEVTPLTPESAGLRFFAGLSVPPDAGYGTPPTPDQVFAVLRTFPEYRIGEVRRRDQRKEGRGSYMEIELRYPDGSYAIDIRMLGVTADDRPVEFFFFTYYDQTEELVRIVSRLTELCGPLVLWHDSGGPEPILLCPSKGAAFGAAPAQQGEPEAERPE